MKFSIKDFCSKYDQIRSMFKANNKDTRMTPLSLNDAIVNFKHTADLVTFTAEILNEKLHFLCGATFYSFLNRITFGVH